MARSDSCVSANSQELYPQVGIALARGILLADNKQI